MPTKRQLAIQEMKQKGMSNAQIARHFGVTNGTTVRDFGIAVDAEKWEQERQDAIKFFNGLTPQQEYDLHSKRRAELKQQFKDSLEDLNRKIEGEQDHLDTNLKQTKGKITDFKDDLDKRLIDLEADFELSQD